MQSISTAAVVALGATLCSSHRRHNNVVCAALYTMIVAIAAAMWMSFWGWSAHVWDLSVREGGGGVGILISGWISDVQAVAWDFSV
ncbi:Hypothetical predicted protein [Olea europaea subsp. europaea]|uniref:Uncharacterized protein n=1 Tax=Olea europaea subsp. europaea TaxID=158383 RepID=A0A8S0S5S1_OLEEU|nr:Hypothetical predicted protein [Olea europaea subsp. europaea]